MKNNTYNFSYRNLVPKDAYDLLAFEVAMLQCRI